DGFNDGFYNMAVDEAVADAVEKGVSPPTLRFYGWKSPTLSIGYSQRLDKKLDIGYCRKNKIDIVQRPTGGRAVLHDKEVTYSLISPKNNPLFPDNISGTYKVISEALIRGLSFLKINAMVSPHPPSPQPSPIGRGERINVCFAAASQYEIIADGKKLIGSAQRRFKKSFLQHGSMPLVSCHDSLASCLGLHEKNRRENFVELLKKRSVALNELNGRIFSYDEVVNAFIKGFEDVFKLEFKIASLSEYELALLNSLH
ncbi:MAG: lipoate--protein ligase family protein, partial [Nitrospinae bacterium]|nr:lipoate--protein ligase family protein [Nitrospinota bacterium]